MSRRRVASTVVATLLAPVLLVALPGVGNALSTNSWVLGQQTGTNVEGWELAEVVIPEPTCALRAKWSGYTGIGDATAVLSVEGTCEWLAVMRVHTVEFQGGAAPCPISLPVTWEKTSAWYDPIDDVAFSGSVETVSGCHVDTFTIFAENEFPDAEVYGSISLGLPGTPAVATTGCVHDLGNIRFEAVLGDGSTEKPNTSHYYIRWHFVVRVPSTTNTTATIRAEVDYRVGGFNQHTLVNFAETRSVSAGTGVWVSMWRTIGASQIVPTARSGEGSKVTFAVAHVNLPAATHAPDDGVSNPIPFPETGQVPSSSQNWNQFDGCTFFFGRNGKYTPSADPNTDLSGGAEDEELPTGGGGTDTPGTETDCNFSLSDPTTWLEGGICALVYLAKQMVGLLGRILTALKNLAVATLEFPVDVFADLFIPEAGYVDARFAEVRTAWDESGPGEWGGAVSDTAAAVGQLGAASGGCAGPVLEGEIGGAGYRLAPLDSCSAPMTNIAAMVKMLLTLVVAVGGLFAASQPILAAFGLNVVRPGQATS